MLDFEVNQAGQEIIGANEVRKADLLEMDAPDQIRWMREWFLGRYEDPAHSLPYESQEGGYIWIDGGPYDPHVELSDNFSEFVPEDVVEILVDELLAEGHEWALQVHLWGGWDDDPFEFDDTAEPAEYYDEYHLAMENNRELLAIVASDPVRNILYGMAFVNLITVMETYLSDTFVCLVSSSEKFMRKFISTTPEFKDRRLSLAEIYESLDGISETTGKYLETVIWHRLGVVQNMYRDTLGIAFPDDLDDIHRAINVRHALVHKNGKIDGKTVDITKERVQELAEEIDRFICSIAEQIEQMNDEEALL